MRLKTTGVLAALLITGCCTAPKRHHADHESSKTLMDKSGFASTTLEPKSHSTVQGKAWFMQSSRGLQVTVKVTNATPGLHGIHIHEIGDCSAADASSAGAHYNPIEHIHGSPDPLTHHAGDLGNIEVGQDGRGVLEITVPSPKDADFTGWTNIIGKSLVLHSQADDLVSQPAGDSGHRIACGVIVGE